jgi:glycine/sarcosine N-methyltransferase
MGERGERPEWPAKTPVDRTSRGEKPLEQRPAILDCACGIGTQALGLALLGHSVHGTDISPVAVERARYEAAQLGVSVTFGLADMRTLDRDVGRVFDVVLAFDNSLPHLVDPADMEFAAHAIRRTLRPGGLFLASTRDYDALLAQRPQVDAPRVIDGPDGRRIVFQVWDWVAGGNVHQFILVQQAGDTWRTLHAEGRYRATRRSELTDVLLREGFGSVRWDEPGDSGYYQPVVIAT